MDLAFTEKYGLYHSFMYSLQHKIEFNQCSFPKKIPIILPIPCQNRYEHISLTFIWYYVFILQMASSISNL